MSRVVSGEAFWYTISVLWITENVTLPLVDDTYQVHVFTVNLVGATEYYRSIIDPGSLQDVEGTQRVNFEISPRIFDARLDGNLACGVNDTIGRPRRSLQGLKIP